MRGDEAAADGVEDHERIWELVDNKPHALLGSLD